MVRWKFSGSRDIDGYIFTLDGTEQLDASYDEGADVLYLWRGAEPREAMSIESREGHLVRVDAETGELVGFTIFEWNGQLRDAGEFTVTSPAIVRDTERIEGRAHVLKREHAPA